MLNIDALKLSQTSLCLLAEIERFQGVWEALSAHTTRLHMLGDVATHGRELRALFEAFREMPINAEMCVRLNKALTRGQGGVRTDVQVLDIPDGEGLAGTLDVASPADIPALLEKLMDWLARNLADEGLHPLPVMAVFAGVFYQIAPFAAENPKTLRQMMTLLMFRKGYSYAPFALLEEPKGADAHRLLAELARLRTGVEDGRPDWAGWIDYVMLTLAQRKDVLAGRLAGDHSALSGMPELSRTIMALFEDHERLGMKEIERLSKGARATLKLRLAELVEGGYLRRHGKARATWYSRV